MSIVLILVLAFGVSTQALLYPNQILNAQLLGNVFLPAYFVLGGDYSLKSTVLSALNDGLQSESINTLNKFFSLRILNLYNHDFCIWFLS